MQTRPLLLLPEQKERLHGNRREKNDIKTEILALKFSLNSKASFFSHKHNSVTNNLGIHCDYLPPQKTLPETTNCSFFFCNFLFEYRLNKLDSVTTMLELLIQIPS